MQQGDVDPLLPAPAPDTVLDCFPQKNLDLNWGRTLVAAAGGGLTDRER